MIGDDLAARYETLRAAAAEVLDSALSRRNPAPYTPELHALHRVLLESGSTTSTTSSGSGPEPEPESESERPADVPDPARHSLAFTDYREDGSSDGPYELAKLAAEIRAELDGDRTIAQHLVDQPLRNVTLTQLRAMVISSLLTELAARLGPGPAVGSVDTGRDLAEIAAEYGTRLLNQTSVGAQ